MARGTNRRFRDYVPRCSTEHLEAEVGGVLGLKRLAVVSQENTEAWGWGATVPENITPGPGWRPPPF